MRLSISIKLAVILFTLTLLVLFLTFGLTKLNIEHRAHQRNIAIMQQHLQHMARVVSQHYQRDHRSWQQFDDTALTQLLSRMPNKDARNRFLPPVFPQRAEPPPRFDWEFTLNNTQVIDAQNNRLAGASFNEQATTLSQPIRVQNDTLGYINVWLNGYPFDDHNLLDSLRPLLPILAVSLLLALGISLLIAFMVTRPIKHIAKRLHTLSAGDYSVNDKVTRKDELGALMMDVNHLSATLNHNQQSRHRWFADISHELRTPLTILGGEIDMLKDGIVEFNQEALLSIDQEIQRLRALVDDLYQLALSDAGALRYHFVSFNLTDFITQLVSQYQPRFADAGLRVSVQSLAGVTIKGDEQRLTQLLTNLFENTLKYTDAPGQVHIAITEEKHTVHLTIEDTAPGITTLDPMALLEPLIREDQSRSRHSGGAGLGLAICKNIVDAHQGNIALSHSALGGLKVEITFPVLRKT